MSASMARGEGGQASVELLALVPLLAAVGLVVLAFLAGHGARESADQAAVAGAVAQLQGGDPAAAAKAASPGWARLQVTVGGGQVRVRVTPRVPRFMARAIDADRTVRFEGRPR